MTTIGSNFGKIDALDIIEKVFAERGFDIEVSDDIQRIISAPYNTLIVDLIHAIEGAYQYNNK